MDTKIFDDIREIVINNLEQESGVGEHKGEKYEFYTKAPGERVVDYKGRRYKTIGNKRVVVTDLGTVPVLPEENGQDPGEKPAPALKEAKSRAPKEPKAAKEPRVPKAKKEALPNVLRKVCSVEGCGKEFEISKFNAKYIDKCETHRSTKSRKDPEPRPCAICGKEFTPGKFQPYQKNCEDCKPKRNKEALPDTVTKVCKVTGKEFQVSKFNAKYIDISPEGRKILKAQEKAALKEKVSAPAETPAT